MTTTERRAAALLAEAFGEGPWTAEGMIERGSMVLGHSPDWLPGLADRVLAAFPGARPRARRVFLFLVDDPGFGEAWAETPVELVVGPRPPPVMSPSPGVPSSWKVPAIVTLAALAARVGVEPAELDWFADLRGRLDRVADGPLCHYDYRWVAKRNGSARLVEAPRPRLKQIQRRLLREIIGPIPPHDAAHGFRPGRSVGSFVAPHAGRSAVLKLDLRDFFPSITSARVAALFRVAGYPEAVAQSLAGLCCNRVPSGVWRRADAPASVAGSSPEAWRARKQFQVAHLPQGAPTSPALANLCAFRLDLRLSAFAASHGAAYTRYADDLAFSGGPEFARGVGRFAVRAHAIALEEGFAVHPEKTRIMRPGVRQQLAGAVINERPNVARDEFDALKAILHNCARHGPGGQDRVGHTDFRAHLLGRIAHVATLNPTRAGRLRAEFDRIAW
ncbi:reverse transcriptase family protein [Tundrisphaera sp. TA3]|uniref:reverse transcriptase family protein n=1 Tax=Tundrisphaera sp. TA3 TaxID=3435775 RepID=UPI003EBABD87